MDEKHFSEDFRERFANHTVPELIELLIHQRAKIGAMEIRVAEAEAAFEQVEERAEIAEVVIAKVRGIVAAYDSDDIDPHHASADPIVTALIAALEWYDASRAAEPQP